MNRHFDIEVFYTEYIGVKKRTRGTETSQYPEERTSIETLLVAASERGLGQCFDLHNWNLLESWASVGDSPVQVNRIEDLSRAGHVQSCLNMGGPPSKPKYSLPTDSELVP